MALPLLVLLDFSPAKVQQQWTSPARFNMAFTPASVDSIRLLWEYLAFLSVSLLAWVGYLLLPRKFRASLWHGKGETDYNGAGADGKPLYPDLSYDSSTTITTLHDSVLQATEARRRHVVRAIPSQDTVDSSLSLPPPPPPLLGVPEAVLRETWVRLHQAGLRVWAHGVISAAKRLWLRLDSSNILWNTEVARKITHQTMGNSTVSTRGPVHKIPVANVLLIQTGKHTAALETIKVPDTYCASIITNSGSLDLQFQSQLERNAVIHCFAHHIELVDGRKVLDAEVDEQSNGTSSLFPDDSTSAFTNGTYSLMSI